MRKVYLMAMVALMVVGGALFADTVRSCKCDPCQCKDCQCSQCCKDHCKDCGCKDCKCCK